MKKKLVAFAHQVNSDSTWQILHQQAYTYKTWA